MIDCGAGAAGVNVDDPWANVAQVVFHKVKTQVDDCYRRNVFDSTLTRNGNTTRKDSIADTLD